MADLEDFTKPYYGLSRLSGFSEVLVILWDPRRPDHPPPDKAALDRVIFKDDFSVRAWFEENSLGRFTIKKKAILGWYTATQPWEFYWREGPFAPPSDPNDPHYYESDGDAYYLDDKGFINGHYHSWAEAIRDKANPDFNYAAYDTDGDGVLEINELPILIVKPQKNPFGTNRRVFGSQVPPQDLIVDGVKIPKMSEAYIGPPLDEADLGLVAHELCHHVFKGADMYSNPPLAGSPENYSIMDVSYKPYHLDPYHKLKLGWLNPRLVERSGWYTLRDVETTGDALILHDPNMGPSEFFIVENRWPGNSFDQGLPSKGLAVWHVREDPALGGNWGREAVTLRRANAGEPVEDALALFNNSSPRLGYDLSDDSEPQNLRFSGNRRSGIKIKEIPAAGESMRIFIEVPPKWGAVQTAKGKVTLLRVHDHSGYGPPDGHLDEDCVILLDSLPDVALGLEIGEAGLMPGGMGMFELLRSAFMSERSIGVEYVRTGTITGEIIRVYPL